jgi:hypothetical protein
MDRLDLMIFGSSRSKLLEYTYKSFQKMIENLSQNTSINKMMHEDYVFGDESVESINYAKSQNFEVVVSQPFKGLGNAMKEMFLNHTKSDYIFYLQDDWEFERPVDIDRILWTMNQNPKINCITFNKYRNMKPTEFVEKEVDFDSLKMCLYPGWQFLPGVWRTSIIKDMWKKYGTRKERPEGFWQNLFGTNDQRQDHNWLEDKVGAYMYGALGEYRYVRHIGGTWRMAEWRRKDTNGLPSGEIHWDFMNVDRDRAPWLPPLEKRPLNRSVKMSKQGIEYYEKADSHIKEIYKDALPKY